MRIFFLILIVFISVQHTSYAVEVDEKIYNELGVDEVVEAVPNDVKNLLQPLDLFSGQGLNKVMEQLKTHIFQTIRSQIILAFHPMIQTLQIILLCCIISLIIPGKSLEFPITIIGCTAIVYLNLSDARSFFSESIEIVQRMYDFSSVLLPCLAGASVFTGASMSAGIKYTAAALFMNILLNFCNTMLVPVVSMYLVCMIGDSVFHQPILGTVSNVIHKVCTTGLTGAVVVFTTYLSVAGLVSGTGELLAARIAKTTLSTGLPIVGKIISDTASTLVAGASLIRNGIGLLGMLALVGMLVIPFISVGVRYLLFKLLSKMEYLWSEKRFTGLIKGISEAYGMMLAIIGSGFVMLFLTLLSFIQVTGVI